MINKIHFEKYRKFKTISFEFSKNINAISGANGTCKTSLLHIISNSFQRIVKTNSRIKDTKALDNFNKSIDNLNPKVESLTKGDEKYQDPAQGVEGSLYQIEYSSDKKMNFRRHNSSKGVQRHRFSLKPPYARNKPESLPATPIVYLGLWRLYPHGEYPDTAEIKMSKSYLPIDYHNSLKDHYKKITGLDIIDASIEQLTGIKSRPKFETTSVGIDSNTISSGEDNIYIILNALEALRYYYNDCIGNTEQYALSTESILLIDEFDATLHPFAQFKLLDIIRDYSKKYGIQVFFTTHSLSLLEVMFEKKDNIIYLIDNIETVKILQKPDIYKINMHLKTVTQESIYKDKIIPIYTEDKEARFFLIHLLKYFEKKNPEFSRVRNYFHLVDANMGAENLKAIFKDKHLGEFSLQSICILDGDCSSQGKKHDGNIITLPAPYTQDVKENTPEKILRKYAIELFESNDSSFWDDEYIENAGFTRTYFRNEIRPSFDSIDQKLKELNDSGETTKGITRELNKKIFNQNEKFLDYVCINWMNNAINQTYIWKFILELHRVFIKVAPYNGLDSSIWKLINNRSMID